MTGGVERGTVETAKALTRAGAMALVASSGGPMVRDVLAAGGVHITLPLESKNPFVMLLNVCRLVSLIGRHNVDLIHARSRAPAWSAWLAAKITKKPFVTTFHNAYGAASACKRFYNSVMAKGDRVIAISDFVASYATSVYGVDPRRLRVIPRGVDIESFDPEKVSSERIETLRRSWALPQGRPLLLMPGRLTRWKGQLVLLAALARMTNKDCLCAIVGGGKDSPYGRDVERAIGDYGLADRVFLFDTCADMPAAYALADAVIVPSTRPEGFGRVIVEAQAMGKPVIATAHGGATENILAGETGWLVPPVDARALAKTIDSFLSDRPRLEKEIYLKAISYVRSKFTTDAMTSKTLRIYEELLKRPFLHQA
ncbi:MAG: glycosyltransferase family 4 protein [Alphaproteobacteria bacterium]|nr:glycosyltransferase family 4 protein [Alphaproteobacteria bacterium]